MKSFRVAACFSGQARHWRSAVNNIKHFLSFDNHVSAGEDVKVDYFIHTWDTNTWRFPKTQHTVFQNETHNDNQEISEAYSPISMIVEPWVEGRFTRAFDPMFYSFMRSMHLKRAYELQNTFEYDLVIKLRLDVVYNPKTPIMAQLINPLECYTSTTISKFPTEFNYNNFDDVMFYGDSQTMDLMAKLYDTYQIVHNNDRLEKLRSEKNVDPTSYYGPGCLLYEHCTRVGIYPARVQNIDYAVIRSTALKENLDGILDYDHIKTSWRDWYI